MVSTYIMQIQQHGFTLYIDLDGYANPGQLFDGYRPDVLKWKRTLLESREYKRTNILR